MLVELMRYRIKPDKSARVHTWMQMLNDRKAEAIETLGRSQIYVEVIFRDRRADVDWLLGLTQLPEDKLQDWQDTYELPHE